MNDRAIIIVGGKESTVGQLRQDTAAARTGATAQPDSVLGSLLSADDRAIIIVGGREATAGPVKQQIQSELSLRNAEQPPPKTATSELNEAAYRTDRLIQKQAPRRKSWIVTPTSRGATFEIVPDGAVSALPVVEIGLDRPSAGADGYLTFTKPVAKVTTTATARRTFIPGIGETFVAVYLASFEGQLMPRTLYHYAITLPRGGTSDQEYGTFTTLAGPVPAANQRIQDLVAAPPAPPPPPPLRRADTPLQEATSGNSSSTAKPQLAAQETLATVRPHSRGASFTHAGSPGDDAYYRMRVQVGKTPPSVAASGVLTVAGALADVTAAAKIETYRIGPNTYVVEVNVDTLTPATRYYYIVTLSNLRGAFHQERGAFTTSREPD
jgi:hypothetical protein